MEIRVAVRVTYVNQLKSVSWQYKQIRRILIQLIMLLMFSLFSDDFSRIRHQHRFNNDSPE